MHSFPCKICFENIETFCAWIFGFIIVYILRQLPGKSKIGTAHAKTAAIAKRLLKRNFDNYRVSVRSLRDYCAQTLVRRNIHVPYTI